jgi:hypothetical protein
METFDTGDAPFPQSPVAPQLLDGDKLIRFRCHEQVACFNACCRNIDISLTPYDILRLKRRLGSSSTAFLREYTLPYEMEKDGLAGVKLRPVEGGTACRFMREEGCSVYADRPTACRYYPVALLSMRRQGEATDTAAYALVKEAHCLGHQEPRTLTVDAYRREQGLEEYDDLARGWRQLILKKKSSGPTVGKPSARSLQLYFMACYDIDRFRGFVESEPFSRLFDLPPQEKQAVLADDTELMLFAFRFLRQVLFGESSIELNLEAAQARRERVEVRAAEIERRAAERMADQDQGEGLD